MHAVGVVLVTLLWIFAAMLIGRAIISWVMLLARNFRPTGPLIVLFEIIYTVTDPPLRLLGRIIPPLRIGGFALDLGFILLFILVQVAIQYAGQL
ncbi:MAG TPA: YggT family protein [Frankiaceae bacterium]|nr:YggT family protein [Frankiaceae bacterium]